MEPSRRPISGFVAGRSIALSMVKLLLFGVSNIPLLRAAPTHFTPFSVSATDEPEPIPADNPTLWIYLTVAVGLVLLGGAFAGLTIALMGQVLSMAPI